VNDTLLARVLDEPELVAAVQGLPPRALGRLVDTLGLEDSGELIAMASTEQVEQLLDDDLWADGALDADRFVVWLEVMLEAGEAFCARRLAALDEELLTLALHKLLLVFDLDDLMRRVDRRAEKAMSSCLYEELGHFQLISQRGDGWDTVLNALLALDREDPGSWSGSWSAARGCRAAWSTPRAGSTRRSPPSRRRSPTRAPTATTAAPRWATSRPTTHGRF
jgi:hypothetical protein